MFFNKAVESENPSLFIRQNKSDLIRLQFKKLKSEKVGESAYIIEKSIFYSGNGEIIEALALNYKEKDVWKNENKLYQSNGSQSNHSTVIVKATREVMITERDDSLKIKKTFYI